jgi:uncharacterized protein
MDKCLIIFIKNPIIGKVKTRIAKTTNDAIALEIYQKLTAKTKEITDSLSDIVKYLYYDNFINKEDNWDNIDYKKQLQLQQNLGKRMKSALDKAADNYPYRGIIGSDCPDLTKEIIESGFELLREYDFAIGRAEDGGFYFLTTRVPIGDIFEEIVWSTDTVCQNIINNIVKNGFTYSFLPTLKDIDTYEDWVESSWSKIL